MKTKDGTARGRHSRRWLGALLVAGAVVASTVGVDLSASAATAAVVQYPVTFTVQNVNRSLVSCSADGATYHVRGHITGTAQALADPGAVTLLLHGLSYGEFFGDYQGDTAYNFADKQASAGHVTVTVDRLGYGASDKPVGENICFGSRADIAHQIVLQLKSGGYQTTGATSTKFGQVVLAGHSVGAIIAQAEAYSFGDIDGLMLLSYSDTVVSPTAKATLAGATVICQKGGVPQSAGGPTGYVAFGDQLASTFVEAHFYTPDADPAIVSAVAAKRSLDPCGDILSYNTAVAANLAHQAGITVPTLVLTGAQDAIYPTPATTQAALLTGSSDVTPITIDGSGHALTFHRTADEFATDLSAWLTSHGFGGWAMSVGSADTGGGSTAADRHPGLLAAGLVLMVLAAAVGLVGRRRRWSGSRPSA